MTMMHLRFTTLLLGVVLSLLAVVLAHKEVAMANNDKALGSSIKELTNEATVIVAAKSGNLKGRKIGVDDATKKEDRNEMINTGRDMSSTRKSFQTQNAEDSSVLPNTEMIGTHKLLAATAEIFKMMNKDYHQKAHRRPPINNNCPLDDKAKDVSP